MFGYETTKPSAGNETYMYEITNAGYETTSSCIRNVQPLGTKRPKRWVRNFKPGYETSWVRNVQGAKRP